MKDIERLLERLNVALTELEGKESVEDKFAVLTARNRTLEEALHDTIAVLDDYIRTVDEILNSERDLPKDLSPIGNPEGNSGGNSEAIEAEDIPKKIAVGE